MGKVKTVTLPKLARKTEDYRGGGMNGTVKVDLGMSDDGLVLESTYGGLDLLTLRQFGMEKLTVFISVLLGHTSAMTMADMMP